jgi:hypothetical protein
MDFASSGTRYRRLLDGEASRRFGFVSLFFFRYLEMGKPSDLTSLSDLNPANGGAGSSARGGMACLPC